jgi:hypothetical protein
LKYSSDEISSLCPLFISPPDLHFVTDSTLSPQWPGVCTSARTHLCSAYTVQGAPNLPPG